MSSGQGVRGREYGAGSAGQWGGGGSWEVEGAGSRELGARSREQGEESREPRAVSSGNRVWLYVEFRAYIE